MATDGGSVITKNFSLWTKQSRNRIILNWRYNSVIFFVLITLNCEISFSDKAELISKPKSELSVRVKKIISNSKIPQKNLGIYISDLKDNKVFYSHQQEKLFIPASLSKIVTAIGYLESVEIGQTFKTELLGQQSPSGESYRGDVCFKGSGDPSFVSEKMWYLVNEFLRSGIKKIEGDLLIDDQVFDDVRFSESRVSVRRDRAYDAPVSGASFNWNTVNVFIRPGFKKGDKARVFLDPENEYVQLKNSTQTIQRSGKVHVSRVFDEKTKRDVIIANGTIGVNEEEKTFFKSISQPSLWTGYNLKSFLQNRGVVVTGNIKVVNCSNFKTVLAQSESKPIEQMISDMQKFSNNYVAEMLVKDLANRKKGQGSLTKGMEVINDFLKTKMRFKDYKFVNPSGFSRENRFSPQQLAEIIYYGSSQFNYYFEFVSSLSISGVDGTLKKRLLNAKSSVRAKSGYLSGVVGLAGLVESSKGTRIFVLIYNGAPKFDWDAKKLFDQLIIEFKKN